MGDHFSAELVTSPDHCVLGVSGGKLLKGKNGCLLVKALGKPLCSTDQTTEQLKDFDMWRCHFMTACFSVLLHHSGQDMYTLATMLNLLYFFLIWREHCFLKRRILSLHSVDADFWSSRGVRNTACVSWELWCKLGWGPWRTSRLRQNFPLYWVVISYLEANTSGNYRGTGFVLHRHETSRGATEVEGVPSRLSPALQSCNCQMVEISGSSLRLQADLTLLTARFSVHRFPHMRPYSSACFANEQAELHPGG